MCFTVHLEERNNPENFNWDVRKTQSDILHFHSLWQVREEQAVSLSSNFLYLYIGFESFLFLKDTSALPSISTIAEKSNRELDDAYTEEVKSALEHFLQVSFWEVS